MSLIGKRKGIQTTKIQFELIIKKFVVFLKRELNFSYDIQYVLIDDADFSIKNKTFGMIDLKNKVIHLSIVNRHPIDILRTFAHEYVHFKQLMNGRLMDGSVGSPVENQANAKAGEIMRKYGSLHPELFDLMPIR